MSLQTTRPPVRQRLYFPPRKRWTRAEYDHLIELGILTPDNRLELLEGEIVRKMPQKAPHSAGVYRVTKAMNRVFAEGYMVRVLSPLALGERSEPEPDVAVVAGSVADFETKQPTTALLVIEVSDTTLRVDRTTKSSLYARAGIAEYAILNLNDRTLEVRRRPEPMRGQPLGFGYAETSVLQATDDWTPLATSQITIAVSELLS